jgi:patatin-related protein
MVETLSRESKPNGRVVEEARPAFAPTQEVRFAVVMYGASRWRSTSNGIVQELLALVRATAPLEPTSANPSEALLAPSELESTERVYRKVGQMLEWPGKIALPDPNGDEPIRTRFVVDVLSGTSAGGINAVFLGKALANEQNLSRIKSLWIDQANIDLLVNDEHSRLGAPPGLVLERPPLSLLNSRRMYFELLDALAGMDAPAVTPPERRRRGRQESPSPQESRLVDELDCWITATDLRGIELPLNLYDEVVFEPRYRSAFRFLYRSHHAAADQARNDFCSPNNPFLAFATRCTASFPFAFEPMELEDIDKIVSGAQIHPVLASGSELGRSRRVSLFGLGRREAAFGRVVAVPAISACACGGGAAAALARVQGARDCGAPARTRGASPPDLPSAAGRE